jgi:S1-C subfamily serine protease
MHRKKSLILAAVLILSHLAASARADEFADKGREIFKKYQHAVVTVQVVIKASGPGGRSNESKTDLTGTVVDASGLTVLALSACDPAEMYRRLSEDNKIEVEVSDIKILLDDGTELSSEIVLRDKDLDLAFIRPKSKPASPMIAIDLGKSSPAQVLDPMVTLNRLNKAASRAYSASYERISAVVQKPRTFYIPDGSMSSTTLGSPAFLLDGKLLGVFVMRAVSSAGGSGNYRQNLTSIILPAEDILKASKQAPEARGDSDKKEDLIPAAATQ